MRRDMLLKQEAGSIETLINLRLADSYSYSVRALQICFIPQGLSIRFRWGILVSTKGRPYVAV